MIAKHPPSEMAYCGQLHASERRSLEPASDYTHRRVSAIPPRLFLTATHSRSFFFGEADFFSAKRLFFRAARDVSGAQRVPPWARVGKKPKNTFLALSHSPSHERALALTSPPPDFLFISIPQCPHPHQIPHPSTRLNLFNLLGLLGLLDL